MNVTIEPWGADDLPLMRAVLGDPRMTEHLGGPESEEALRERQERYARISAAGGPDRAFRIHADAAKVGFVGYWEREWRDEEIFEIGWSVLPDAQGRGVAQAATRLALEDAAGRNLHRWVHAFPTPDNLASNAICRRLGFELLGEVDFEYPKGTVSPSNDWRFDLRSLAAGD